MCVNNKCNQCADAAKTSMKTKEIIAYMDLKCIKKKSFFLRNRIIAQVFLTSAVMVTSTSCGMPVGFSAILLPQLKLTNSTIQIDEEMGSWVASIHCVATPFGSLLSAVLMDRLGRKVTIQFSLIPLILGWILITFALSYPVLLMGRLLAGLSAGLSAAAGQVLIAESTEPNLRGMLSSGPLTSYSFGIVLISALGLLFTWRYVAGLSTILPIIAVLAFTMLPESPVFLIRNNKQKQALEALTWLRGGNATEAKEQADLLVQRVTPEMVTPPENIFKSFVKPHILKPLLIINIFNVLQILSGTYTIVFYAVEILSHMKIDSMDHFLDALILACTRFFITIITSLLLLMIGRRTLALLSGVGSTISALCIAVILQQGCQGPNNLTKIFLFAYVAMNTVGFFVLPGVLLGELFPSKVRGYAGGFSFMLFNVSLFLASKTFPFIKSLIGVHGIFYIFGSASLLATVFLFLVLPETKNQTLEYIEHYFEQNNIFWVCRDKNSNTELLKSNRK